MTIAVNMRVSLTFIGTYRILLIFCARTHYSVAILQCHYHMLLIITISVIVIKLLQIAHVNE